MYSVKWSVPLSCGLIYNFVCQWPLLVQFPGSAAFFAISFEGSMNNKKKIGISAVAGLCLAVTLGQNAPPAGGPPGGRGRGAEPLPAPNTNLEYQKWAPTPPMGWNSWDSYGAGVWQADVLANADYMEKNLKAHGWNLITIDIQWYEPKAHTTEYREGAILETDANGRLLPAPNRFPLTADTRLVQADCRTHAFEGVEAGCSPYAGDSASVR